MLPKAYDFSLSTVHFLKYGSAEKSILIIGSELIEQFTVMTMHHTKNTRVLRHFLSIFMIRLKKMYGKATSAIIPYVLYVNFLSLFVIRLKISVERCTLSSCSFCHLLAIKTSRDTRGILAAELRTCLKT